MGDRGIRLSGGQRQRIGIARALYRKTEILVLDEATSSLDVETEKKLIQDIERLKGNYTFVIVTHRLSTIKNCEKIIFLNVMVFPRRCHISTNRPKCDFQEIGQKCTNFSKNTTSSKMVVWGWYMTHNDRRDPLNSKKLVWGGFPHLPGLLGPICDFLGFFGNFEVGRRSSKNRVLGLPSPKKMFEN